MPSTDADFDNTDEEDRLTAEEEAAAQALYKRIERAEEHIRAHRAAQGSRHPTIGFG